VLKRAIKFLVRLLLLCLALSAAALLLPRLVTGLYAWPRTYSAGEVPGQPVAIVFGAGLQRDGRPTAVLRDRVTIAAQLYFSGKVEKLLMSGDNRFIYYNEPGAMWEYALALGVPEEAIVQDYAGRRTYDTCYRARQIFGIQDAVLVTQGFHLARALYTCNQLDVSSVGVPSDLHEYRQGAQLFWYLRETVATAVALWEVHISQPLPVLGDPEPIFPHGY
jgi:vancomycin permeability regulator SanA